MADIKVRFVKQGNKVIVKQDVTPEELDSKAVLKTLKGMRAVIDNNTKGLQEGLVGIKQMEQRIKDINSQMDNAKQQNKLVEEQIKDLEKHKSWAQEIQKSKFEGFMDHLLPMYQEQVDKEFVVEEGAKPEAVVEAKFMKLQDIFGRDPEVAEGIFEDNIKLWVYKEPLLKNPWSTV